MSTYPQTPPDPMLSMTGRRIMDLTARNMSLRQIARHLGCSPSQVQALRNIPSSSASRTLITGLETLHENVLAGKSKWGRMVDALVAHGWTLQQIAIRADVTEDYLRKDFGDPLVIPSNSVAEVIEGLYERHVANNVRREWA